MTVTREISWREFVLREDPEWEKKSRRVVEYEFSAPGKAIGDERTHEGGKRVFWGNYRDRGPYATEE